MGRLGESASLALRYTQKSGVPKCDNTGGAGLRLDLDVRRGGRSDVFGNHYRCPHTMRILEKHNVLLVIAQRNRLATHLATGGCYQQDQLGQLDARGGLLPMRGWLVPNVNVDLEKPPSNVRCKT